MTNINLLEDLHELAIRAHSLTSHVPAERGEQIIKEYSSELEADLEFVREYGGDEKRYTENYRKYFSAWLAAKSRCASWMITGRANFPVRKMEKANESECRRADEFRRWRARAKAAIACAARRENKSISTGVEDMRRKIAEAEQLQKYMKLGNKLVRKHKGDLVKIVSEFIAEVGLAEKEAKQIFAQNYFDKSGFPPFRLTNNNANIKRMKERLADLESQEAASGHESVTLSFSGGEVVMDFQENRVKLLFPAKPDSETIIALKKSGFRWSPKGLCWQRQLTANALHAVTYMTNVDPQALFIKYREARKV